MPYTPPAGNAVLFDFRGLYTPPAGNAVLFNFGASIPPPPPGTPSLPTGLRQAIVQEDDWYFMARRRFAPPIGGPIPLRHTGLNRFRLEDDSELWTPWTLPRRARFAPPATRRRRAILFTVT